MLSVALYATHNSKSLLKSPHLELSEYIGLMSGGGIFTRLAVREVWTKSVWWSNGVWSFFASLSKEYSEQRNRMISYPISIQTEFANNIYKYVSNVKIINYLGM